MLMDAESCLRSDLMAYPIHIFQVITWKSDDGLEVEGKLGRSGFFLFFPSFSPLFPHSFLAFFLSFSFFLSFLPLFLYV